MKILVFPFDLLSHYTRCVQWIRAAEGEHQVVFADGNYSWYALQNGFTCFPYQGFDAQQAIRQAKEFRFNWLHENQLESVFKQTVQAINEYHPDLILGDAHPILKMACAYTKTPYVSILNAYMSKHYAHVRRLPRIHPAYRFSEKTPDTLFDFITKHAERFAFQRVHKAFRSLRKKYRLPDLHHFLEEYEGDYTFIADLPSVFPLNSMPSHYRSIRPLFVEDTTCTYDFSLVQQIGRKKILISLGSTGNTDILKHLGSPLLSDYVFIVTGVSSAQTHTENVFYFPFVPNMSVLPLCDAMICHGGNGSIYQALFSGKYILAQTALFEQDYNMQAIERLGLGKRLPMQIHAMELASQLQAIPDVPKAMYTSMHAETQTLLHTWNPSLFI